VTELGRNDSDNSRIVIHPTSMKFRMQVESDDSCTTVCHMTWSNVKVTSHWKLEFLPFLNSIYLTIYNGSWQMTI